MKVAIWYNLPSGGGRRALHDHVLGLLARGHTVEAWCPPTADRTFLPFGPKVREHVVDLTWPVPWRLRDTWQLKLQTEHALAAMEAHCKTCAAEIDAAGFDVLFANSCMFFGTSPIGRLTKTPAVLYLQEPVRMLYEAMPRLPWLPRSDSSWSLLRPSTYRATFIDIRTLRNNRMQAHHEVKNAGAFRGILVNSHFSRESLLRAYGVDSEVCYLGIDTDRFSDAGLRREGYVVGLGSIIAAKGIQFCIESIAAVREPRPKLIWVGNFANERYLTEMLNLARARQVVFEPMVGVSEEKLVDVLNRASLMVYAPRLEPFGLAPLEANACGVPVVAVAEGGVRETVVDEVTGLLIVNEPAAMAHAVTRLLAEPERARALGTNARARVLANWALQPASERIEQALLRHARQ